MIRLIPPTLPEVLLSFAIAIGAIVPGKGKPHCPKCVKPVPTPIPQSLLDKLGTNGQYVFPPVKPEGSVLIPNSCAKCPCKNSICKLCKRCMCSDKCTCKHCKGAPKCQCRARAVPKASRVREVPRIKLPGTCPGGKCYRFRTSSLFSIPDKEGDLVTRPKPAALEKEWIRYLAWKHMATGSEVLLPDSSRADLIFDGCVWEVDRAYKWQEGVGQAAFYKGITDKLDGGVLLLINDHKHDKTFITRCALACKVAGLRFKTEYVGELDFEEALKEHGV